MLNNKNVRKALKLGFMDKLEANPTAEDKLPDYLKNDPDIFKSAVYGWGNYLTKSPN